MSSEHLAFIGLGNIGIAKNLAHKGSATPLTVYNRTRAKADKFKASLDQDVAAKMHVADSLEEALQDATIVLTCLGQDDSVISMAEQLTALPTKGTLFVDCSTIHPHATTQVEAIYKKAGAHFVAMPVFGAPCEAAAEAGQLICVPAGPKKQVDRLLPFLEGVIGRAVINMSDKPCFTASQLKIIGNTVILGMVENLAQGHVLAEKSQLGTDVFHSFISLLFPGPYTAYSNRMLQGDYYNRDEPLFAVDLALKDARHAKAMADESGSEVAALDTATKHLRVVKELKQEKGDIAGIYGAIRHASGLNYENQ